MKSKLEVIELTILGMPWRVFAVTIEICTLIYMSWSIGYKTSTTLAGSRQLTWPV
jgi:hypothetical protein